jgi:nucleotide-binding universal stress UspA family protein
VEYAASVLPHIPECEVLLLALSSVIPEESEGLDPSTPPPEVHGDEDHSRETEKLRAALDQAADLLRHRGLQAERLQMLLKPMRISLAQAVVEEATTAGCDTIIVGRRGLSRVRGLLQGSVSGNVVQKATGLTVWVVG